VNRTTSKATARHRRESMPSPEAVLRDLVAISKGCARLSVAYGEAYAHGLTSIATGSIATTHGSRWAKGEVADVVADTVLNNDRRRIRSAVRWVPKVLARIARDIELADDALQRGVARHRSGPCRRPAEPARGGNPA
jgi:hypothetical protein